MRFDSINSALALPADSHIDRRVPKKLLLEYGAPTAADKRQIQEGIEEITWVAALKPTNIGFPAFKDDLREYLEIAVVTAALRTDAKALRLIELIHRAIPYPLILISSQNECVSMSLAHKRWSQGEAGKVVIEDVRQEALGPDPLASVDEAFLASLTISKLPSRDLFALYDGLLTRITALEAARITGVFLLPEFAESSEAQRDNLETHARLMRELATLRAQAKKEKQINRRVEINTEIKRLETQLATIGDAL
jgi:hypothetical protein